MVTSGAGAESFEGPDGFLYFCELGYIGRELKKMPISGGLETLVLKTPGWSDTMWDLTDRGVYFIDRGSPQGPVSLLDLSSGKVSAIAVIDLGPRFGYSEGVSVSSDGQWLYFAGGPGQSDIRLIENFR